MTLKEFAMTLLFSISIYEISFKEEMLMIMIITTRIILKLV